MTRQEMIKKLEEIKEEVAWDRNDELTEYTRVRVYYALDDITDKLQKNRQIKEAQKMTKQEQIEEMAVIGCVRNPQAHTAEECAKCDFKQGKCNAYRHAEKLYDAGYRKVDEFEECRKCPAWSGTDCTRNPYTEGCLDDKVNLKNEIKRLEKENEQLKAKLETRLIYDFVKARQNYAVQNFAEKLRKRLTENRVSNDNVAINANYEIDELLKEYE